MGQVKICVYSLLIFLLHAHFVLAVRDESEEQNQEEEQIEIVLQNVDNPSNKNQQLDPPFKENIIHRNILEIDDIGLLVILFLGPKELLELGLVSKKVKKNADSTIALLTYTCASEISLEQKIFYLDKITYKYDKKIKTLNQKCKLLNEHWREDRRKCFSEPKWQLRMLLSSCCLIYTMVVTPICFAMPTAFGLTAGSLSGVVGYASSLGKNATISEAFAMVGIVFGGMTLGGCAGAIIGLGCATVGLLCTLGCTACAAEAVLVVPPLTENYLTHQKELGKPKKAITAIKQQCKRLKERFKRQEKN